MPKNAENRPEGPWNPGIGSTIPKRFLHLSTMFRPENVSTSIAEADDLADFTGLAAKDLVAFRLERLVIHELLIRIMADVSVPDGSHYGDLGINFRQYTDRILHNHIMPEMPRIAARFEQLLSQINEATERALAISAETEEPQSQSWWQKWTVAEDRPERAPSDRSGQTQLEQWRQQLECVEDALEKAVLQALIKTVTAISAKHGRLVGEPDLLNKITAILVLNRYGSERVGAFIAPLVQAGIKAEGLRTLPIQSRPVIMNVKGASAAGKSTLRPLQQKLAERIGVKWEDFALISPDIWRKYLLDYDSLAGAYKYAGMLTGHELEIIDRKLDRYMAEKALDGKIPHLLIDRFRFDSFATQPGEEEGGRLLTRFGDLVYMFFVITPPEATVERAWARGLEYGRYKAVDDLLDHNVEAFTGMPRLFFTWALNSSKRVHYEFLDNSVPKGERPRTIAFGWNGEMTILDIKAMLNIDRFAKINVGANAPDEVYDVQASLAPEDNAQFLIDCAHKLSAVTLADQDSGRTYAQIRNGAPGWVDAEVVERLSKDDDVRAGLTALLGEDLGASSISRERASILSPAASHTLGRWGAAS